MSAVAGFTDSDLRYIADGCNDEGVYVSVHDLPEAIEELTNLHGREPTEQEVIDELCAGDFERAESEAISLAKYSTRAF